MSDGEGPGCQHYTNKHLLDGGGGASANPTHHQLVKRRHKLALFGGLNPRKADAEVTGGGACVGKGDGPTRHTAKGHHLDQQYDHSNDDAKYGQHAAYGEGSATNHFAGS